jgi:hypothetical protein
MAGNLENTGRNSIALHISFKGFCSHYQNIYQVQSNLRNSNEMETKKKAADSFLSNIGSHVCGHMGALHALLSIHARLRLWSSIARLEVV